MLNGSKPVFGNGTEITMLHVRHVKPEIDLNDKSHLICCQVTARQFLARKGEQT